MASHNRFAVERRNMKYNTFVQDICQRIQESLCDQTIEIREVLKNNGVRLMGLTITDPSVSVSPTIYLERFYDRYQNGEGADEIAEQIVEIYEENRIREQVDFDSIYQYDHARENLYLKVVNAEKNADLLKEVPHRDFLDLALLPYLQLDQSAFGNATTLIRDNMLSYWNVKPEELLDDATKNMQRCMGYTLTPILDILRDHVTGEEFDDPVEVDPMMYVLFLPGLNYSAVLMTMDHIMAQVAEELNADLYVLPSSIHEVIIIPASDMLCLSKLGELVKTVNETTVSNEEILSDHAYFYKRGSGYQSS